MNFIKSHKKISILIVVVLIAAVVGAYVFTSSSTQSVADVGSDLEEARTVTIAKGSLKSTVNVSGKVISAVQSDVTTETTTAKVTSLNVKVGDTVKKGDVICQLDTSDIDSQIKSAQKAISDAEASNSKAISAAQRTLSRAQEAYNKIDATESSESQSIIKAEATYQALDDKVNFKDKAQTYNSEKINKVETLQKEITALEDEGGAYKEASDKYYACYEEHLSDTACVAEKKAFDDQTKVLQDKQAQLANLKTIAKYDDYQKDVAARDTAKTAWENAKAAKQTALDTAYTAIVSAQDSLADAQNVTSQDTSTLEKLQKQREGLTLKAETDGEITALNVKLGSLPSKSTVATIQSTSQLIFEVTIPENYINKVSKGLSVTVTADSIDEPVTGILTMISSTAGDSGSSTDDSTSSTDSSKSSGYKAQVTLSNAGQLHIGSSAKGSILLAETDNVFVVPIDAVGTDEGLSFIRVKQSDGTYKKISVKTGNQNDTEIEVSGEDLEEGMEVLSNVDYEALVSEAQTESEQEAASASES